MRAHTGRVIVAIRDRPVAASSMGVDTAFYKSMTFGLSAMYTGIAGALGALAVQFVGPDSFSVFLSISLLVGVVVGGLASISGAVYGALFIQFVPNLADDVSKAAPSAVYGVVLILSVYLMPRGVAGLVRRRRRRARGAPRRPERGASCCVRVAGHTRHPNQGGVMKSRLSPSQLLVGAVFVVMGCKHGSEEGKADDKTPAPPAPRSRSGRRCRTAVRRRPTGPSERSRPRTSRRSTRPAASTATRSTSSASTTATARRRPWRQVRKLVEQDQVLFIFQSLGTPSNAAIQPYLNDATRCRSSSWPPARRAGPIRSTSRGPSGSTRATSSKERRTASTSRRTSRARRSPCSTRTTTTERTSSRGSRRGSATRPRTSWPRRPTRCPTRRRLADRDAQGLRRGHVRQRHDAEVRRAGDPQGVRHRLEADAVPEQRRGLRRVGADPRRARQVGRPQHGRLLQGPDRQAVGRRPRHEGVEGVHEGVRPGREPDGRQQHLRIHRGPDARAGAQAVRGRPVSRANVMKQAANLKDFAPGLLLPGIKIEHRPERLRPLRPAAARPLRRDDLGARRRRRRGQVGRPRRRSPDGRRALRQARALRSPPQPMSVGPVDTAAAILTVIVAGSAAGPIVFAREARARGAPPRSSARRPSSPSCRGFTSASSSRSTSTRPRTRRARAARRSSGTSRCTSTSSSTTTWARSTSAGRLPRALRLHGAGRSRDRARRPDGARIGGYVRDLSDVLTDKPYLEAIGHCTTELRPAVHGRAMGVVQARRARAAPPGARRLVDSEPTFDAGFNPPPSWVVMSSADRQRHPDPRRPRRRPTSLRRRSTSLLLARRASSRCAPRSASSPRRRPPSTSDRATSRATPGSAAGSCASRGSRASSSRSPP